MNYSWGLWASSTRSREGSGGGEGEALMTNVTFFSVPLREKSRRRMVVKGNTFFPVAVDNSGLRHPATGSGVSGSWDWSVWAQGALRSSLTLQRES